MRYLPAGTLMLSPLSSIPSVADPNEVVQAPSRRNFISPAVSSTSAQNTCFEVSNSMTTSLSQLPTASPTMPSWLNDRLLVSVSVLRSKAKR